MSKPIEILYTPPAYLYAEQGPDHPRTPVVRYADHCAKMEELEQHRACAIRRNDELLKQLERMALLCEEQATQIRNLHPSPVAIAREEARWNGKPKAL